jgi:hypothetical protein
MNKFDKFLNIIPKIMNSKLSICIYLAMFVYLVILPILSYVPGLEEILQFSRNQTVMLIGDNYTSVLAALGASIAAGMGVSAHVARKKYEKSHQQMKQSIDELHAKLDRLSKKS